MPNTKSVFWWRACVCVLTCPVNPSSYIYSPERSGWLSDRARHQVGNRFCCRDGNRSPIRPISARTLIDWWELSWIWWAPGHFCHAIVIYIVRPYHLIAILHYHTLLGQFVRAYLSCAANISWYGEPMCPVVDWIKCVSGGRRGEPTGLWRELFSHYGAIPSAPASGMWPLLLLPHQADISWVTYGWVLNQLHSGHTLVRVQECREPSQSEQHVFVNPWPELSVPPNAVTDVTWHLS